MKKDKHDDEHIVEEVDGEQLPQPVPAKVDGDTDDAVEDIDKKEQAAEAETPEITAKHKSFEPPKQPWFKRIYKNKKVAIPATVVVVLLLVLAIPFTRYSVLGLFLKQTYAVTVLDNQTGQPVTAATITLAGKTATTDNHGKASVKAKVGHGSLVVSKKYYSELDESVLVGLKSHAATTFKMKATGRQVPVVVTNKISGKPIANAEIKAADTEAKTDSSGKVTIVLPADKSSLPATVSASGYNDASVMITVTTQTVKANQFQATPAGKIYFLSNLSGKIDVVKTNLDGTDRQTVLTGTGFESNTGTVMLASNDWKFLALLSVRDSSSQPQINLIDTSDDKVTNIDKGDVSFNPIGWIGDSYIYSVSHNGYQPWQSGQTSLKGFDADSLKLNVIDQTQASGDQSNYAQQSFNWPSIVGDKLVYFSEWSFGHPGGGTGMGTKQTAVISSDASGDKTAVKSWQASDSSVYNYYSTPIASYQASAYEPGSLVFSVNDNTNGNTTSYDEYKNGTVTENDDDAKAILQGNQPVNYYLPSPSGNQTFWSESQDGKNALFVGDANGGSGNKIATLSDYDVYGWYSDNYLLVFKNSSELYIMPVGGGTPLKITDYYKPSQQYVAYGGR